VAFAIVDPISSVPFEITSVALAGNNVSLTFNSKPGGVYAVWRSANLVTWTELDDNISSQGNATTFVDQLIPPRPANLFYYVAESP
jgi:hypothetical protein